MIQQSKSVVWLILLLNLLSFVWSPVFAENSFTLVEVKCGAGERTPSGLRECEWPDVVSTIRNILRLITTVIAFVLASIFVIVGALMYMFGGPSPNTADRGKRMMIDALKGYALVVLAAVILDLFLGLIQPKLYVRPGS